MDIIYTVFIVELLSELVDQNNGDSDKTEYVHDLIDMSTHCLIEMMMMKAKQNKTEIT